MAVKFVDRHMRGFMYILEASEGFLSCGRKVSGGAVFETFSDALSCMNASLESNRKAFRKVRSAVIVEYEGMASCQVHVPDKHESSQRGRQVIEKECPNCQTFMVRDVRHRLSRTEGPPSTHQPELQGWHCEQCGSTVSEDATIRRYPLS